MPVFDFSGASDKKPGVQSECTYTTFQSNEQETSPEKPIMVLDNSSHQWKHHSCGIFTNLESILIISALKTPSSSLNSKDVRLIGLVKIPQE